MIKTLNLAKKIGNKQILKNINLHIAKGEFITVFGPNGAGKSTLLKNLALLMKPTEGKIIINGRDALENPREIRGEIGVISHNSFLYDNLSAQENLEYYGRMYNVPNLKDRVYEVIKEVGLEFSFKDPAGTFSRGMVQRLSIARAILHKPSILFLDEPYTGLDQQAIEMLNGILAELHGRQHTIFMITHNIDEGMVLSNRVMILAKGKILFDAPTDSLSNNQLKGIYLEKVVSA